MESCKDKESDDGETLLMPQARYASALQFFEEHRHEGIVGTSGIVSELRQMSDDAGPNGWRC